MIGVQGSKIKQGEYFPVCIILLYVSINIMISHSDKVFKYLTIEWFWFLRDYILWMHAMYVMNV